ncbi:hypothetical protein GGR39_000146 [Novosphingobium fluoreni]|uniref:DUF4062 domain-containing protein n=1 Tax=Novosphingobium fluoreni TaxID=1391222 RepID=A0A7W6C4X3_9SPHN|nr:DUF4062 domain-containing protein [Novosphingobium fluoreni]MBB3938517.1 hypothetical protein [Novosphingobium fluoreni]
MFGDVRYQVFISSTYEDLREERQQVTQAILELGHMPVGMELFPASDLRQADLIRKVIDESDYYVVLVGGRYGSIDESTGSSFTEMEYDYALTRNIPLLGFVRDEIGAIPGKYLETDPAKKEKLEAFRAKVLKRTCRKFSDPLELGLHVLKSLVSEIRLAPQIGWVRADQAKSIADISREQELRELSERQKAEITRLKKQLRDGSLVLDDEVKTPSGKDKFAISLTYNDREKQLTRSDIEYTYDDLLKIIGPSMFGYIQRRPGRGGAYSFEGNIIDAARMKIYEDAGSIQINLLSHQIDILLLHLKQMGILEFAETKDEDGGYFRGMTLTEYGERYLTTISLI